MLNNDEIDVVKSIIRELKDLQLEDKYMIKILLTLRALNRIFDGEFEDDNNAQ